MANDSLRMVNEKHFSNIAQNRKEVGVQRIWSTEYNEFLKDHNEFEI